MDFTPAESQQAVAGLAAEVLAGADPWKELARAGLLSVGPGALGLLDVTALLTEIGRRAPSLKAHATLMTGALPVLRWGSDQFKQDLLPGVASGELLLTAAMREPSDPQPDPPVTALTNGTITGTKVGVPHAKQAHLLLVPARLPASSAGVALVSPHAAGVRLTRTPSASGEPECTLRMDRAPLTGMLGGADCVRDLYQLAIAGVCALADGAVAGALALTRDHVASRQQFGRPLAAFQAVTQQIAEVYIASRTMHLATLAACWRLDAGPEIGTAAGADLGVAGYWCAEQAPRSVRTCHHLHGGLGMDATYPLHRFSSLVADLVRYLGGAEYRLERLACSST
jgi:3-oxo-4-pregnene-20-carboxyl-CoA dehydrogenase alpha subunit